MIAGVVDTGDKFLTSVNDTGEQLSPVTTTPAINLLQVTRTRTPWRWGAAKDRRKLKGTNRWYLRPPKSDTAADGVIGTVMKSFIQRHSTHPDQRPLRPPKVKFEVVLAASGASYQDVRGAYGCNFSWRFQWHHRRPCPTSAAGNITDLSRCAERTGLYRQYSLSPMKNLSTVSLTRKIVYLRCCWHRRTIYWRWKWKISINSIFRCKVHPTKLLYLKIFHFYPRCRWHRW